jgi:hypothetical protein
MIRDFLLPDEAPNRFLTSPTDFRELDSTPPP